MPSSPGTERQRASQANTFPFKTVRLLRSAWSAADRSHIPALRLATSINRRFGSLRLRQPATMAAIKWPSLGWAGSISTGRPCNTQSFRRRRTDRSPPAACVANAARESPPQGDPRYGDREEVLNLLRRCKQRDSNSAHRDLGDRSAQRLEIFGKRPAIDSHLRDGRSSQRQALDQLAVRSSVFLHRNPQPLDLKLLIEQTERFVPGVGRRDLKVHSRAQLAQGRNRLGPARDDASFFERSNPGFPRHPGLDHLGQVAHAGAGLEDDHVESARRQRLGECRNIRAFTQRESPAYGAASTMPLVPGDHVRHEFPPSVLQRRPPTARPASDG